jgi:hypothetical protein
VNSDIRLVNSRGDARRFIFLSLLVLFVLAPPKAGVERLVEFMNEFQKNSG